jgi:hypothetical protein
LHARGLGGSELPKGTGHRAPVHCSSPGRGVLHVAAHQSVVKRVRRDKVYVLGPPGPRADRRTRPPTPPNATATEGSRTVSILPVGDD